MIIIYPFIFLVGIVLVGLYIRSIIWAYDDAEARGKSGLLVAVIVLLFFWPSGLLLWLSFRPDKPKAVPIIDRALIEKSIKPLKV